MAPTTKPRRGRRASRWLALGVLGALVLAFAFGARLLDAADRAHRKIETKLGKRLVLRHGLVFLASLDETAPRDATSSAAIQIWDAPKVAGRHGFARRIAFNGRSTVIRPQPGPHFKTREAATYALWIRPVDTMRRQTLVDAANSQAGFRLALEGGRLVATLQTAGGPVRLLAPFDAAPDRFTHVAVAISEKEAALFQNGRETARAALPGPVAIQPRPLAFAQKSHSPFEGDIDDLAIWRRPLSAREIASVARSRRGLREKLEPAWSAAADLSGRLVDFLGAFYRVFDRLAPTFRGSALLKPGVPVFSVWMSRDDERHFRTAHEKSLKNGYRTPEAAKFRRVKATVGGKGRALEFALDDVYGGDFQSKRPSFLVRDPDKALIGGGGVARLYPPELHTTLHPDAPRILPLRPRFVRLSIDDAFKGLYLLEHFDRAGSAWMARGARDPHFPSALHFAGAPSPADAFPPDGEAAFRQAVADVAADHLFPWSRQEMRARGRRLARNRRLLAFSDHAAPLFDAAALLGENPAMMYVVHDLPLPQAGVAWSSSAPEVVSPEGKVRRPEDGRPRNVVLTAVDSATGRRQECRVRVMPRPTALPALFLHIGKPVEKFRRADFTCLHIPAGDGAPEWLAGCGDTDGGAKHRGNTSYVKSAKRSMSLRFDAPVPWPGSTRPARHVLLFSGYADPTRLRNKISFDAFLGCDPGDGAPARHAPEISWAEVFVNGEYFGVWETSRRAKDFCEPKTLLYKVRALNPHLWTTTDTSMTERISAHDPRGLPYAPLEALFGFTSGADRDDFAAKAGDWLWLDNVVDYLLVLNFSENVDGQFNNQYLARRPGDSRWFIVPWDYDKTFFPKRRRFLSNPLVQRLYDDVPGFRERVAARWRALRAGPLSDVAVFARIDADAALLAPCMEDEFRLLAPLGFEGDGFPAALEELKDAVRAQFAAMDECQGLK